MALLPVTDLQVTLGGNPAQSLLQPSDLTWVGCFGIPKTIGGQDTTLGWGLALRYVGGEQRFLFNPWNLSELRPPATLGTNPATPPMATVVRVIGKVPDPSPHNPSGGVTTYGIYWDEPTQLLWYGHGRDYNTNQAFLPTIGAASLDPTLSVRGIWGLLQRPAKTLQGGFVAVPPAFAAQYTQGRRLAGGFGGYFSIIDTGPVSMGPALTAFDPEALLTKPNLDTTSPHTPLVGYPFTGVPYQTDRCHRDTDVINDYDGWDPQNGVGYWTWNDTMWEAGVWIDTPTKAGVLFAPTIGNGRGWYLNSTLNSERGSHAWLIYDPADLARVAQGQAPQWGIQPSYTTVQYPGVTYPLPGWTGGPNSRVAGIAFDATARRLYIALRQQSTVAIRVHVYDVAL